MKSQKKPLPKSQARNAYELLRDVRRAILEEPKRYTQSRWGLIGKKMIKEGGYEPPACGTMACVAGWCVALVAPDKFRKAVIAERKDRFITPSIPKMASSLLMDPDQAWTGTSCDLSEQIDNLFEGDALDALMRDAGVFAEPGSRLYAKFGAKHIANFMRENRKALTAHKLPVKL